MFESGVGSVDCLEQDLLGSHAAHGRLWANQLEAIRRLDAGQVDMADGCRSMVDWLASRLDVTYSTARDLLFLAKVADFEIERLLADGEIGLERAVAMVRLRIAGADEAVLGRSRGYDLAGVFRLLAGYRRITLSDESSNFESRYLVMQPSLDESVLKYWGQALGVDAEVIQKALWQRAEEFPHVPGVDRAQALADSLTSICADSLTGGSEGRAVTVAELFVDAALASETSAEAGVTVSSGPRVGPNALAEILCGGRVRVVVIDADGRPLGASHLGETIPPAVRAAVWRRDQGMCTIEGCRSNYRLEIHHLRHRSEGGDNHPDNLTLLCWFHHHVAIHQMGMEIDQTTPPQRRSLGWRLAHGPPR